MRRITELGRHMVTITGWDYQADHEGRNVVFSVENDAGEGNSIRFGLSQIELRSGILERFVATVLQRNDSRPEGMPPSAFLHMRFNHMVGRRVVLFVKETDQGTLTLVSWEGELQCKKQTAEA